MNWEALLFAVIGASLAWFAVSRFRSWLVDRWADRLLKKISQPGYKPPPKPPDAWLIELDSSGFALHSRPRPGEVHRMTWMEVTKIGVYNRDMITTDMICMFVEGSEGGGLQLDEEMDGWQSFAEALPAHLPGCKPWSEWFMSVAFPAFETNLEVIYQRHAV
jgi:hypothetical protein